MNKPTIHSVINALTPKGVGFHEVAVNVEAQSKETFWKIIGKCRNEASIIEHVVHDNVGGNVYNVLLKKPRLSALQNILDAGNPIITTLSVEAVFTANGISVHQALSTLCQHIGCRHVEGSPNSMGEHWVLSGDRYTVELGIKSENESEIYVRVTAHKPQGITIKRLIGIDWNKWLSNRVWVVVPKRKEIGQLLRDRKGLVGGDSSTFIRTFNRGIGTKHSMGQFIVRRSSLLKLSDNKSSQLFRC